MEVAIIKIGNSRGLRLSKTILEQYDFKDKVELILEDNQIVIRPMSRPRQGWEARFKSMSDNRDDTLLIDDVFGDESFEAWS
jgi:antitoxin MazE